MMEFLNNNQQTLTILHVFSMGLGLGATTVADFLFFRFLRDLKITQQEAEVLNTISKVIWVVLVLIIISGLGLYLPDAERLNDSSKFMVKLTVIGVILLNGVMLNTLIGPRLSVIFGEEVNFTKSPRWVRKLAFAGGAISMTSWYSVFILGSLRKQPYTYWEILGVYLILLLGAITISQVVEYTYGKKRDQV